MTKSELKTGMVVVNRCGEKLMVFKDVHTKNFQGDCIVQMDNTELYDELEDYDDNLMSTSRFGRSLDIVKVMTFDAPAIFFSSITLNLNYKMNVIWERYEDAL